MTPTLAFLFAAMSLVEPARLPPDGSALDVPYLPQTASLCGGAAAAMVFRFWGDRHADVQQFAPLVDRAAGGIPDDVLIDAVQARGWKTVTLNGHLAAVRDRLTKGQPVIVLLESRRGRYHYVVVVGAGKREVVVHDPTWGPSRRLAIEDFERKWERSRHWALVVLPADVPQPNPPGMDSPLARPSAAGSTSREQSTRSALVDNECDRLVAQAIDDIGRRGLGAADELLGGVRVRCPDAAAPVAELAGVRFAQQRWSSAESLAEDAALRDPTNHYAWDVLGSSRFMQDDLVGALRAWNRIGKPRLDSVGITGLDRTRYALVAQALDLTPNGLLTPYRLRFAERRLEQLPGHASGRIGFRPEIDGFATVDVAVVERSSRPTGRVGWIVAAIRAAIDREAAVMVPGGTGQGEMWSASWRWWSGRPRLAFAFTAPRVGRLPGVWRVEGSWEAQTYWRAADAAIREERTHGAIAASDWLSPDLRYELVLGLDSWNRGLRAALIGGTLEHRFRSDRFAVSGSAHSWRPLAGGRSFESAAANAAFRSSKRARGFVYRAQSGIEGVTADAPLSLWPGAGDGHARPALLRAHALLHDGVVAGPSFGRRLTSANVEAQRWFERPSVFGLGVAAFGDAALASKRIPGTEAAPFQVDAGIGLRIRLPGREGTIRVDYGRGLRDGSDAVTVGWQY